MTCLQKRILADWRGRSGLHLRYANILMVIYELIFSKPVGAPEKAQLHWPKKRKRDGEKEKSRQSFWGNQLKLGLNDSSKTL